MKYSATCAIVALLLAGDPAPAAADVDARLWFQGPGYGYDLRYYDRDRRHHGRYRPAPRRYYGYAPWGWRPHYRPHRHYGKRRWDRGRRYGHRWRHDEHRHHHRRKWR